MKTEGASRYCLILNFISSDPPFTILLQTRALRETETETETDRFSINEKPTYGRFSKRPSRLHFFRIFFVCIFWKVFLL
jgi:hypothetical protein